MAKLFSELSTNVDDPQEYWHAYKRALAFAERLLKRYESTRLELSALDVTHSAIEKTLSSERPWDKNRTPDLFVHLAGCIKSIVNNAYMSAGNKRVTGTLNEDFFEKVKSYDYSAENILEHNSAIDFILSFLKKEKPHLLKIADLICRDYIDKPQDLSEILGIEIDQVNIMKRDFKRIISSLKFSRYYVKSNRPDLLETFDLFFKKRKKTTIEISRALEISQEEAQQLKNSLFVLLNDIKNGEI